MHYQLYDIAPALRSSVNVICSMEDNSPVIGAQPLRVLPDTRVELFINLQKPQQLVTPDGSTPCLSRSFITSRMNQFMDVRTQTDVAFISVCFSGGQAYRFFPMSMHEIANRAINLRDVWGQRADDLQEHIDGAQTMAQRVDILQQYLIQQLHQAATFDSGVAFCVAQIKRANGRISLDELANQVGISNRQLVRRFNERVGLSPKEFARITAFKQALKQLKNDSVYSLTQIAYDSGYYDQAHFIHTCRDYSGLSPRQLLSANYVLC